MFPNLNAEMARKGISSYQMAGLLGVSSKTMSNKLLGYNEFKLSEMRQIADMFPGTTLDYLFRDDVKPKEA